MSRYLTSGKIALLALVELYAESRFANASVLPVMSFVIKHLVSPRDNTTFILRLEQLQEATIDHDSKIIGRKIFDLLLQRLWDINCFDALHTFFTDIQKCIIDPDDNRKTRDGTHDGDKQILRKTSILGCFVRRACLEYTRLQFNDAVALWRSFVEFREPTLSRYKKRNLGAGTMTFDMNLAGMSMHDQLVQKVYPKTKDTKSYTVSTDDVERLLEFQVDVMQRMGTRVPDGIQAQLCQMLETNVPIPSLSHYVEFLNAWRAGDYPASFDNLHRYFDYTMHNRDRTFYQYALLNLSILQADFGCYRESVLAMQETINTARENRDMACLNFSLSWLYHFHKAHPRDCPEVISSRMERDSLQFLKAKAKEGGMHHLQSMAHLSEAKQLLLSGESIPAAFECLVRSSHLNVTKHIRNAMGSQILLQSSLWSRLGVTYLAWTSCEVFLEKYREDSPVEDVVKAICRGAYIISMRGRFEDALERLDNVDQESVRSLKVYQYWTAYVGLIKLRRAVYRNEFAAAELLLEQLTSLPYVEPDCAVEVSIVKIELQMRNGNFSAALDFCAQVYDELIRDQADIFHKVRLMVLKAEIYSACGRPIKGLSTAISAASIAWKARLMPAVFHAFRRITAILTQLEEYTAAYTMLDSIMPQVLECEDASLNAQCFACLADIQIGLAGMKKGVARNERLNRALDFIDRAFSESARIRDISFQKQMISRKTKIQDSLGDKSLRDDAVKMYRQLQKWNT